MSADIVTARGALQLPYTSYPVPVKSNTALPFKTRMTCVFDAAMKPQSSCLVNVQNRHGKSLCQLICAWNVRCWKLNSVGKKTHILVVDLYVKFNGRSVIHVVDCIQLRCSSSVFRLSRYLFEHFSDCHLRVILHKETIVVSPRMRYLLCDGQKGLSHNRERKDLNVSHVRLNDICAVFSHQFLHQVYSLCEEEDTNIFFRRIINKLQSFRS